MEERITKLEYEVSLLKRREKEIYVLCEYDNYIENYKICGCFDNPDKVIKAIRNILGYDYYNETDLINLMPGKSLNHNDGSNSYIKIEKFLLE